MTSITNYLIISAIGSKNPDILSELTRTCNQCGCNILHSRVNLLGQDLAINLFVAGNWGAIAKMEAAIPNLEQKLGLNFLMRRTVELPFSGKTMTYNIQISAIDKPGILNSMTDFLNRMGIPIEEITANTYLMPNGTRMANLLLKINVPESIHLASLREQFMTFCDDNNLDAFLEPVRP